VQVSEYYDGMTPDEWKPVLGERLNYHFGFYRLGISFEQGLRLATRRLLPFFAGERVLDVGCGWGGPAIDMAQSGYKVVCATNSTSQYEYCKSLGLNTSLLDIEYDDLGAIGCFDTVVMMESLDHVFDKPALLHKLIRITNRLVIVTNCCGFGIKAPLSTFGNTMCMVSTNLLLRMLETAGWRVLSATDVRKYSMPTFLHWKARIEAAYPAKRKPPVELLHGLCEIALQDMAGFEEGFPLMAICAEASGDSSFDAKR
jgi:cyclopropane fatty-acyl-phospholipid synthase-like methyltransferase